MSKKILIIEDDEEMRNLEKELLETVGYEILESADSNSGIDRAINEKPDIILMDIRLPNKKRGIGAARILRNNVETSDIPIIFVTGYVEGEYSNEVKNIKNCSYITKPFEIKTLIEEIRKYI